MSESIKWSYGITTVPQRRDVLLPRTIESLRVAGFDRPHLFIDKCDSVNEYRKFDLPFTARFKNLKTFGHWVSSLWELYATSPHSDRYAIFQDDFVTCRNLKAYLDACPYPKNGYLNLLTFRENHQLIGKKSTGWHHSDQLGKGAVALVFNRDAVLRILTHPHMTGWARDPVRGKKLIDRALSQTLKKCGYKEFIHNPSLIQHTGLNSSMGSDRHPLSTCFRGEDFDAMEFLNEYKPSPAVEDDPQKPTIRVALPAVDSLDLTTNCLRHLAESNWPLIVDYVDNGSKPGVIEAVNKAGKELGLTMDSTRWPKNKGFTPAVNVSMKRAIDNGQYCLILNNDCMVAPQTVQRLVRAIENDPGIAAAGPLTSDKGIQSIRRRERLMQSGLDSFPAFFDQPEKVSVQLKNQQTAKSKRLAFFCTLISPEALKKVGILPAEFADGLGADDAWCHLARKAGMTCNVVFDAYAYHMHSQTFKRLKINRSAASKKAVRKLRKY
jgi:GT2 family glycosyltransferase